MSSEPKVSHQDSTRHVSQGTGRVGSRFGPGLIIAASFVGPGTITTSIVTGASYGFALAWAVVFSIIATIVLQEMSARLGLATRLSLGEAFRRTFESPLAKTLMVVLVVSAIGIGGASYAGGDTTGTSLAITSVTGLDQRLVVAIILAAIFVLLWTGSYKLIEKVLMVMVAVLAVIFIVTAVVSRPPVGAVLKGMFVPSIPAGSLLAVIALIGTTVVPYNLFLHASLVQENWQGSDIDGAIHEARRDSAVSISVGGLITLAVMASAFGAMFIHGLAAEKGSDLANALRPLLGGAAPWVFALGLFSAGFTSAVAGPLGAAYAIAGTLGRSTDLKGLPCRIAWISVLAIGGIIALTGVNPIQIIIIAQAANGILLPVVAGFLLYTMNNKRMLGHYVNGLVANMLGGLILLVVTGLAVYQILDLFGLFG